MKLLKLTDDPCMGVQFQYHLRLLTVHILMHVVVIWESKILFRMLQGKRNPFTLRGSKVRMNNLSYVCSVILKTSTH